MRYTAIAVIGIIVIGVVVGIVMRARKPRTLTTTEIVELIRRIHAQTGVDPAKPEGFTVQPDGTWVPIKRDEPRK